MSKHLFILGAGASVTAGAPVMKNFLDRANDLYQRNRARTPDAFKNVFQAIGKLQLVHSKAQLDIVNLESVFNAFEMAKLIDRLGDINGERLDKLIADLKTVIVETLELSIPFKPYPEKGIPAPGDYEDFAAMLKRRIEKRDTKPSFSFISFNYDVCLDFALERQGLTPNYYLKDIGESGFPLLKLHGSLNWYADSSETIHSCSISDVFHSMGPIWTPNNYLDSSKQMKPLIERRDKCTLDNTPTIIPPAWNKSNHHSSIKNVWKTAARELSTADNIYIIGFSMPATDAYFSMLFGLGTISDKPLRTVNVYNPDTTGEIEKRFGMLLGPGTLARYDYFPLEFSGAVSYIEAKINDLP